MTDEKPSEEDECDCYPATRGHHREKCPAHYNKTCPACQSGEKQSRLSAALDALEKIAEAYDKIQPQFRCDMCIDSGCDSTRNHELQLFRKALARARAEVKKKYEEGK